MKPTILIIGRGIAGLSLAYELLCLGSEHDVVVIGPAHDPQAATPAAMGVSVTKGKGEPRQPLFAAKLAGHAHLKSYLPRVERETGVRIRRIMGQVFEPFQDEQQFTKIKGRVFKEQSDEDVKALAARGLDEMVQADALRALAKMPAAGAFSYPGDLWFDPRDLLKALAAGVVQRGGTIVDGRVDGIGEVEGQVGLWRLSAATGETWLGTTIVLAAGVGASLLLQGLQLDQLVVEPVVGVTVEVDSHRQSTGEAAAGRGLVVLDGKMNLVSYENALLFGSTSDQGTSPPPDALDRLNSRLRFFVPGVDSRSAAVPRVGVRARFSDRLPVIGPVVSPLFSGRVWLSLGYYKNGLQLAPLFCRDLAQWIVSGTPSSRLSPFLPDRFLV